MSKFRDTLDTMLLADILHSKQCKKKHSHDPQLEMYNSETHCDYYNNAIALSNKVKTATARQRYVQKSKDILTMCENMNMEKIIRLVNTIIES